MPECNLLYTKMPMDIKPKIHEGRKSSKPLMEKKRRARINDSLSQLKSLILEATNKDSSRHSKLEKADILEMTVKHLRTVQRSHLAAPHSSDVNMASRFRQGYNECIHEVARFFMNIENIGSSDMRLALMNHLANCCNPPTTSPTTTQQPSPPTSPVSVSPVAPLHVGQPTVSFSSQVTVPSPAIASAAVNLQATQPVRVHISPAPVMSCTGSTTTSVETSPVQHQQQHQQHVQSRVEEVSPPCNTTNTVVAPHAQVLSGIPVGIPGTLPSGEITLVLPPQALTGGQLPSHFIPVYAQGAPVLTSPTISPASQGPVCAESPKAYTHVQVPAQTQLSPQQVTTVQTGTFVAVPAPTPAPTPVVRNTKVALQTAPQSPCQPKTVLQTVNVQSPGEPVWRPWNHGK